MKRCDECGRLVPEGGELCDRCVADETATHSAVGRLRTVVASLGDRAVGPGSRTAERLRRAVGRVRTGLLRVGSRVAVRISGPQARRWRGRYTLREVPGIGSGEVSELAAAGIESRDDLLRADPYRVAALLDVDRERVALFQLRAAAVDPEAARRAGLLERRHMERRRALVETVPGIESADLLPLAEAGIDSPGDLAAVETGTVAEALDTGLDRAERLQRAAAETGGTTGTNGTDGTTETDDAGEGTNA